MRMNLFVNPATPRGAANRPAAPQILFFIMTLNQFNLSAEGQTRINDILNRELSNKSESALTQYGYAGMIKKAGENAQQTVSHEGILEALEHYPDAVLNGKRFCHNGCDFSVQRTPVYDFKHIKSWAHKADEVAAAEDTLKLLKTQLKNHEQELIQQGIVAPQDYKLVLKTHLK